MCNVFFRGLYRTSGMVDRYVHFCVCQYTFAYFSACLRTLINSTTCLRGVVYSIIYQYRLYYSHHTMSSCIFEQFCIPRRISASLMLSYHSIACFMLFSHTFRHVSTYFIVHCFTQFFMYFNDFDMLYRPLVHIFIYVSLCSGTLINFTTCHHICVHFAIRIHYNMCCAW